MPSKQKTSLPYPPSWMDRLVDWVDRLPMPSWLFYVLFFFLIVIAEQSLLWLRGAARFPNFEGLTIQSLIWTSINFATFHYLGSSATAGIDGFRDALPLNDHDFKVLKYRFTITPATTGWIATALAAGYLLFSRESYQAYFGAEMFEGWSALLTWPLSLFLNTFLLVSILRIGQTFIQASQLYSKVKKINLFDISPLYGISVFSYRIGMFAVVAAVATLLTNSSLFAGNPNDFGYSTFFYLALDIVFGLAAFIFPLLGLHRLLVNEKERVAKENGNRLNKTFWQLQNRVDKNQLKGINDLRTSVSALMDFRQEIKKLPTWPWETGTFRNFLTALAVPMTVWVVQQVLLRTVVK
jgi:hypothetical protein